MPRKTKPAAEEKGGERAHARQQEKQRRMLRRAPPATAGEAARMPKAHSATAGRPDAETDPTPAAAGEGAPDAEEPTPATAGKRAGCRERAHVCHRRRSSARC